MQTMEGWLIDWKQAVQDAFGTRVQFLGIQGSAARGEATPDSDWDLVVLLDQIDYKDVEQYASVIKPWRQERRLCGFFGGVQELKQWDRGELLSFYFDTTPIAGNIDWILPLLTREEAGRAVQTGCCTIYHMCVHNAIFERDRGIQKELCKQALFTLRALHYQRTGNYPRTKHELREQLQGDDAAFMDLLDRGWEAMSLDEVSQRLLAWAKETLCQ